MMVTHKGHTGKRLEDDKREIGNDLKFYWKTSGFWMYHPKVLYNLIKRRDYLNALNQRKDICSKELIRHEQILEGIGEQADSETIEGV